MMISVADARMIIRESVSVLPAHYQPISLLQGRVLAEELSAPFAMPRFTNAAMDGFALRHADIAGASSETPVILRVIAEVAAGAVPVEKVRQETCAQIMTGAPMPDGADTVIPFEQTSGFGTSEVSIFSVPKKGANIRHAGEEVDRGASLLQRGTVLTPGEIAVLAAFGIGGTMVYDLPKIALVTVGSELRLPGESLKGDAEIYNCNRSMMEALCLRFRAIRFRRSPALSNMWFLRSASCRVGRFRQASLPSSKNPFLRTGSATAFFPEWCGRRAESFCAG